MPKVTVQPSGHVFEVQEGETVLSAALRQNIMLPYGCKNGACGSCKGGIVSGAVDYGKSLPAVIRLSGAARRALADTEHLKATVRLEILRTDAPNRVLTIPVSL